MEELKESRMRGKLLVLMMVLMTCLLAPCVTLAQANLPKVLGMLPEDAEIAFAVDLGAFNNPKSLMSLVPRKELEAGAAKALAAGPKGDPAVNATEAGLRVAFSKLGTIKINSIAIGFVTDPTKPGALAIQRDYAVMSGNFKAAEMATALKTLGVIPWSAGKAGLFPSQSGAQLFVNSPADNLLIISSDSNWLTTAPSLLKQKAGLTAQNSSFDSAVDSMGGRSPDFLIYMRGDMPKRFLAGNAVAGMLLGPFIKSKGSVLSLHAGDVPTVEFRSSFADTATAGYAQTFLEQAIILGRSQVTDALSEAASATEKKSLTDSLEMINKLKPEVSGKSTVLRLPIAKRPTAEQVREQVGDMFESAMKGELDIPAELPF